MTRQPDDLRRLLRDADPAASRGELPELDRARMRSWLTTASRRVPARRRPAPVWALAAAALAFAILVSWSTRRPGPKEFDARVPPAPTRIVFTAPEGTRILWFVGTPDAKELGS